MERLVNNRQRIVPSGLSVSGWYIKSDTKGTYSVHADVVFKAGKFGGDKLHQIEFELNLRRADVVIVCGDGVTPLKRSFARPKQEISGTRTYRASKKSGSSFKSGGAIDLRNLAGTSAAISAEIASADQVERITEITEVVSSFFVQHFMTEDNHPAWEVRDSTNSILSGSPWGAVDAPRLDFRFEGSRMSDEPHVRIEVRCRSEDLDFGDGIKPKDKSILSTFKNMINRDVNKAAAEQYLKSVLMKEGLLIAELDHIYGNVTLADVVLTLE